ncbi:hypothetical protein JOQ06_030220 [Pogonophryne albipinna]|uniref:SCD domain-containing protein n=1 Tax=Pogonophryne albipinna TaxID=1090488 RepID=A0AAD6FFN5_9TELE|nr:hypothetical protein JOQ06_030220 [Pogonophryne albipinna]
MGWMMHDKIPDVRLKCVLGLQGLYVDPQLLPKLDLFTSRFKDRLISMTLDKDNEVAVQTMKLLLLISRTSDDSLSPEDYQQLLQLVYSSQRPLAAAAGELLFSRLLNTAGPTSDTEDEINKEGVHKQPTSRLKALLQFYQESELHKHVVYLVDSLWDVGAALLKDWPTLTSILLQDPSSHAPEGPSLAGRSGAKKVMNAKERKIQNDDCTKLTDHFLVVLPKLLSKFSESSDCVASLMKIPQFFLPECPDSDNTQAVSALTAEMETVLERHTGPSVLEAAAPRDARDSVVQSWVDQLTELLGGSLKGDSFSADEEKTGDILATLKKLRAFHNCHNLLRWNLFELLSPLLSVESSEGGAPPEVLLEVLQCLSSCMIWSLSTSTDTLTSRQQAFLGVCDVLTAHSFKLQVWDPSCFGPLLYTPSPKLQRALSTFLCMHVFTGPDCESQSGVSGNSEEERLEELHKRRNMLAAFCKLIVHRVLEMSMAAEVFIYYMKYFNEFGDIIKEMMCRTRQMDKIESARTLVLCLQQLLTFTSIRELARRFALSLGDQFKFRECVVMIHRNGIEFVFSEFSQTAETPTPPYLSYLPILSEFSSKLLKPDKKTVFSYLQKHTAEKVIDLREESRQPLLYYRASLLAAAEGEDAASYVSSDRKYLPSRSKLKLEGCKSPCPLSPSDSKVAKVRKSSFSPSHQEKTADTDPFSIPVEPPAKRSNIQGTVLSILNEADDDTVEVEL